MNDCQHSQNDNKFWFGFFFGGLIGAIVLFFIGTKEGKKTGKLVHEKGQDLIDVIQDRLEALQSQGKELVKEGEDFKEEIVDHLEDHKEKITKDVVAKLDTTLSHIEEMQERGREATAEVRKIFKNLPKKSS
jgi:gas vesicle protein